MNNQLTSDQRAALSEFIAIYGKHWKFELRSAWMNGRDTTVLPNDRGTFLRQIRNTLGPAWLSRYNHS